MGLSICAQDSLICKRFIDLKGFDTVYAEAGVLSIGAKFASFRSKSFNIKQAIIKTEELSGKIIYYLTCNSKIVVLVDREYLKAFYTYKKDNTFYLSEKF